MSSVVYQQNTNQSLKTKVNAFITTTKPRVVAMMLLTTFVGMVLSSNDSLAIFQCLLALLGIGLVASSGASINHVIDMHIDQQMNRTKKRPLASGILLPRQVIILAAFCGVAGMSILLIWVNMLTAWLTLGAFVGYAFIYTGFLKWKTPQNIVIGGLSGALPPLLGWTAVTDKVTAEALALVMIIFVWTPPHFWALAIFRKEEYAKVGVPMLPVTHGEKYTALHIVLYTWLLLAVSMLPFVLKFSGVFYLLGAIPLGVIYLYKSHQLLRTMCRNNAWDLFRYSIFYLLAIFVFLLLDRMVL